MKIVQFFGVLAKIIFSLLIGVVFLFFIGWALLIYLGNYLNVKPNPVPSGAIVVLSGGETDRFDHGLELYQQKLAPLLIFSGAAKDDGPSNAYVMAKDAQEQGVSNQSIIIEGNSRDTYENAKYVLDICREQQIKSILLVTSPYHQRRATLTFAKVFAGSDITINNAPSTLDWWQTKDWWKNAEVSPIAKSELIKIFWLKFTGKYD